MTRRGLLAWMSMPILGTIMPRLGAQATVDRIVWDCRVVAADTNAFTPAYEVRNKDGATVWITGPAETSLLDFFAAAYRQQQAIELRGVRTSPS